MNRTEPTLSRRGFVAGALSLIATRSAWPHPGHATESRFVEFSSPTLVLPRPGDAAWFREQAATRPEIKALVHGLRRRIAAHGDQGPRPLNELIYEGRVSNDPERIHTVEHLADTPHIYRLAWLQAVAPNDDTFAALSAYVDAWAGTYRPTGNAVNDVKTSPLLVAFALHGDAFDRPVQDKLRAWTDRMFTSRYKWALAPGRANGHARHIALCVASARLLGHEDKFEPLITAARALLAAGLRSDGTSYDLEYRDAMHYHRSFVQSQLTIAALLRPLGVDLWGEQTPGGASIRKSVDYMVPYSVGEKERGEWAGSEIGLDQDRAATGDPAYQPGSKWDPRSSAPLFRLASGFDPRYHDVLARIPDGVGERTTWEHFVDEHAAGTG